MATQCVHFVLVSTCVQVCVHESACVWVCVCVCVCVCLSVCLSVYYIITPRGEGGGPASFGVTWVQGDH